MDFGRNYVYGTVGFVIPTVLLFAAVPVLVEALGREGFGIYFFAISLTGTIALLDIGIGNSALRFFAADLASKETRRAGEVAAASLLFYLGLGGVGATTVWLLAPWLASTFGGSTIAVRETEQAFRIAAMQMLPALLVSASLALFKGLQRFDLSATISSLIAAVTYGGAIVTAYLMPVRLTDIVLISLLANCIALAFCVMQGWRVCRIVGIPLGRNWPSWGVYRRLLRFGMFMTINSVSAFFLYHVQRFLVGALLGPSALAAFQIAQAIPSKAHAFVNSGAEILFPRASAETRGANLRVTYVKVLGTSILLSAAVLVPLWIYGEQILGVWIGGDLTRDVYSILPSMLLGFFMVSISSAPFHVVNGINRPELNTLSWGICAILNVCLIGAFAIDGLTLGDIAWAFAIANVLNGLAYQAYVEFIVWRQLLRTHE